MKAWKASLAGVRGESLSRRCEDGEAEIVGDVGDVMVISYLERGYAGEGNPQQMEAVMQSFRDGGSWSLRMETLETWFVSVRQIVFCPPIGRGGEMLAGDG